MVVRSALRARVLSWATRLVVVKKAMGTSQHLMGRPSNSVTRSAGVGGRMEITYCTDILYLLYFTGMRVGGRQDQFDARVTSRNPSQIWNPGNAGPPLGVI